jgi:hypothetical protein
MMTTAEWYGILIADLTAQRPWLGKAQMMRVRGCAAANQAGPRHHEAKMLAVAQPTRLGMAQFAFVDPLLTGLIDFRGRPFRRLPAASVCSNCASFRRKRSSISLASAAVNVPLGLITR